ncbi:DNA-3-methyladenine glycosylase, partial [Listeria monocytogenes]
MDTIITNAFFENKTTIELARDILGMRLVHQTTNGKLSGLIVETEAYLGATDRAAHSFQNLRTKRTEVMFSSPGRIYMYQMHRQVLLNFITMPEGIPEAILIRAIEPDEQAKHLMEQNRGGKTGYELTNGPGKLTQALGLSMQDY